jgi:hypothetical protein
MTVTAPLLINHRASDTFEKNASPRLGHRIGDQRVRALKSFFQVPVMAFPCILGDTVIRQLDISALAGYSGPDIRHPCAQMAH